MSTTVEFIREASDKTSLKGVYVFFSFSTILLYYKKTDMITVDFFADFLNSIMNISSILLVASFLSAILYYLKFEDYLLGFYFRCREHWYGTHTKGDIRFQSGIHHILIQGEKNSCLSKVIFIISLILIQCLFFENYILLLIVTLFSGLFPFLLILLRNNINEYILKKIENCSSMDEENIDSYVPKRRILGQRVLSFIPIAIYILVCVLIAYSENKHIVLLILIPVSLLWFTLLYDFSNLSRKLMLLYILVVLKKEDIAPVKDNLLEELRNDYVKEACLVIIRFFKNLTALSDSENKETISKRLTNNKGLWERIFGEKMKYPFKDPNEQWGKRLTYIAIFQRYLLAINKIMNIYIDIWSKRIKLRL